MCLHMQLVLCGFTSNSLWAFERIFGAPGSSLLLVPSGPVPAPWNSWESGSLQPAVSFKSQPPCTAPWPPAFLAPNSLQHTGTAFCNSVTGVCAHCAMAAPLLGPGNDDPRHGLLLATLLAVLCHCSNRHLAQVNVGPGCPHHAVWPHGQDHHGILGPL